MQGVYFVTGKLGAGKGIFAAKTIQDFIARNRKIATNYPVETHVLNPKKNTNISVLPGKPRSEDLELLGTGFNDKGEFGLLVLDELATWFNSRSFRDKDRSSLIDWFVHARKLGWTVLLLVQSIETVDKQLINSICEFVVECGRLDKLRIPIFSDFYDLYCIIRRKKSDFSLLPHYNIVTIYQGKSKLSRIKVDKQYFKPSLYFGSYDTNQLFEDGLERLNGRTVDMRASYTYLSANYFKTDNSNLVVKSELPKKKSYFYYFLFIISLIGAFYFLSPGQTQTQVQTKQNKTQSVTSFKESKSVINDNSFDIAEYVRSSFSTDYFISGYLVDVTKNKILYTFVDQFGEPFYPQDYGLQVVSFRPCHAKIYEPTMNRFINLSCKTTRYKPDEIEIDLQEEIKQIF